MRFLFAFVLTLSTTLSLADSVDINVNDDAARIIFTRPFKQDTLQWDAGWLNHQDRGDVAHLGFHLKGKATIVEPEINAGLGGKFFWHSPDRTTSDDGWSLALGGFFRFTIPQANRFGVGGHLYFAPDVLSFSDAEEFREVEIHVSYNVIQDADIYIAYRNIQAEYDDGSEVTFDTGFNIGIRVRF